MKNKFHFSIRWVLCILGFILLSAGFFLGGILFITSRNEPIVSEENMESSAIVLSEETNNTAIPLGARQIDANISNHTGMTFNECLKTFELLGVTCGIYAPAEATALEPSEDQLDASEAAQKYLEAFQKLFPDSKLPDLDMLFYSDYQYSGWLIKSRGISTERRDDRVNAVTGKVDYILFPVIDSDYFVKEEKVIYNNRTAETYKTNPVPFLNLADIDGMLHVDSSIKTAHDYIKEYELIEDPYRLSNPQFNLLANMGAKSVCFETDLDYPKSITVYLDLKSDTLIGYSHSYPN